MRAFVAVFLIMAFANLKAEDTPLLVPKSSLTERSESLFSQDEAEVIKNLILSTQTQLEQQIELQRVMMEFKQQEEAFIAGLQTKKHSAKMVRSARKILGMITDWHWQHLFPAQYMEELIVFAAIAGKNTPPHP